MHDTTTGGPPGPEPHQSDDAAYEEYLEVQAARGKLAFAPESLLCPRCGGPDGVERPVVAAGPIVDARRDPTQTYRLACGHTVI